MLDKTQLTIETYNQCASSYEARFMDVSSYQRTLDAFLACVGDSDSILDLGCGPGNIPRYLLSRKPALRITGIDLSEEMIRLARRNVPEARFELKDVRQLDFPAGSFDHAVASFCLPFLDHQEAGTLVEALARVTRPAGCIYVSTMMGTGSGFETTSFSDGRRMFFNYYTTTFLEDQFARNALDVAEYFAQEYAAAGSQTLTDMIYILRKTGR